MVTTIELSVDQVIDFHNDIIRHYGGEPGLRDPATLDYIVYQVNKTGNMYRKASAALHGICTKHPFIDGNKRTAFVVANNILGNYRYKIGTSNDDVVSFMLEVASYIHSRASVESWIKKKAVLED